MILKVLLIVFICTSMNHLGLIEAIEKVIGAKFPILNCCKCSSFWATFFYLAICHSSIGFIWLVAISFLSCFLAIWLELSMGILDILYSVAYERIFNETTVSKADRNKGDTKTDDKGDTETEVS